MFLFLQFLTLCLQYVNCCSKSFTRTHRVGRLASKGNQHKDAKSQRNRNSRGDKITLVDRKIDIHFLCFFLAIFDPIFQASSTFCYFNVIIFQLSTPFKPKQNNQIHCSVQSWLILPICLLSTIPLEMPRIAVSRNDALMILDYFS